MNETATILRLKDGDKDAFELLYNLYWQKVYNFTRLYITHPIEVEEVLQEVFVKLWEVHALIDETKNFEGFLFIITRNLIFNCSRRSFYEDNFQLTLLEAVEESYNVEDELAASELRSYLDSLLEMLSPRQREVFHLSREEHLTYKEIAIRLQISEKTVEHHISYVLKFLKKNLQLYVLWTASINAFP